MLYSHVLYRMGPVALTFRPQPSQAGPLGRRAREALQAEEIELRRRIERAAAQRRRRRLNSDPSHNCRKTLQVESGFG